MNSSRYSGDTFESGFERLLPEIETEEQKCYRLNIKRINQLKPGQKRPPGGQIKFMPDKKQIMETKENYKSVAAHFRKSHIPKTIESNVKNDTQLLSVLHLVVWYLSESDLSRMCLVSKSVAKVILSSDHRWRSLMRNKSLMPCPLSISIHRGMAEYKMRHYWTTGKKVAVNHLLKFSLAKRQDKEKVPFISSDQKRIDIAFDKELFGSPGVIYPSNGGIFRNILQSDSKTKKVSSVEKLVEYEAGEEKVIETFCINAKRKCLIAGSNSGELSVIYPTKSKKSFLQKVPVKRGIHDISSKGNLVSISDGDGDVNIMKWSSDSDMLTCVKHVDQKADYCSLSSRHLYLIGQSGAYVSDIETGDVVQSYRGFSRIKAKYVDNSIYLAKKSRISLFDIRLTKTSRNPCRIFEGSQISSYFSNLKGFADERQFHVSTFTCDDVKIIGGKTNGDIVLWDMRKENEPVWVRSTAMDSGLEKKRWRAVNLPRIQIESLDFSITKIFAISRYSVDHVAIL